MHALVERAEVSDLLEQFMVNVVVVLCSVGARVYVLERGKQGERVKKHNTKLLYHIDIHLKVVQAKHKIAAMPQQTASP